MKSFLNDLKGIKFNYKLGKKLGLVQEATQDCL